MPDEQNKYQPAQKSPEDQPAETGKKKESSFIRMLHFLVHKALVGSVLYAGLIALVVLVLIMIHIFSKPERYPGRARTYSDMRTLSTGLESYFIDHKCYPAWTRGPRGANAFLPRTATNYSLPTFRIKIGPDDPLATLTTPVAYLTTYLSDPFAPDKGAVFCYYVPPQGNGWIVWSAGPDGVYEIDPAADFDPAQDVPSVSLLNKTYDPSNGTESRGDVWRTSK